MRRAAKRDGNEPDIVYALRKAGWLVKYLNEFDLLIFHPATKRLRMLEVKTETGALKPSQEKMIAEGWPLEIVRTIDQALRP